MSEREWWVLREGITLGPYGRAEMRRYIERGKLQPDDLTCVVGQTDWVPATLVDDLREFFPLEVRDGATRVFAPPSSPRPAPPAPPARGAVGPAVSPMRAMTLPPRPAAPAVSAIVPPSGSTPKHRNEDETGEDEHVTAVVAASDLADLTRLLEADEVPGRRWYVARGTKTAGPLQLAELRHAVERGELWIDDLLCAVGTRDWLRVGDLPELADVVPPVPAERVDPTTVGPSPRGRPDEPHRPAPESTRIPDRARWSIGGGLAVALCAGLTLLFARIAWETARGDPAPTASPGGTERTASGDAQVPGVHDASTNGTAPDGGVVAMRVLPQVARTPASRTGCIGEDAIAGVRQTWELLDAVERLMAGAAPPPDPFDYASLATACMTTLARANNRPRAALDSAQVAAAARARRAAEARHAEITRQWRSFAWIWDPAWSTRTVNRSATYGCWDEGWTGEDRDYCEGEWRVRTPAVSGSIYTIDGQAAEPELTRRIEGSSVHPEADQFCSVVDAMVDAQRLTLRCAFHQQQGYEFWLPRELGLPARPAPRSSVDAGPIPAGILADVMIGDVVRIRGHRLLKIESREEGSYWSPRRVERWTFEDVSPDAVSVEDRMRCCTIPEPLVPAAGTSTAGAVR